MAYFAFAQQPWPALQHPPPLQQSADEVAVAEAAKAMTAIIIHRYFIEPPVEVYFIPRRRKLREPVLFLIRPSAGAAPVVVARDWLPIRKMLDTIAPLHPVAKLSSRYS